MVRGPYGQGDWGKVGLGGAGPIDFHKDVKYNKYIRSRQSALINGTMKEKEDGRGYELDLNGPIFKEERARLHICDQGGSPLSRL